jgi:hypothetical protein
MSALAEALVDSGFAAVETLGRHYTAITGRVVPWNQAENVGAYLEEWRRGAFTRSLTRQSKLPLLPFHDGKAIPVGTSEAWSDEPDGLYGVFAVHMHAAAQVASDYAERGVISGLSIGFVAEQNEWRYAATYAPELGVDHMDRVIRTRARLVEVSLVSTPAFVDATVTSVDYTPVD